MATLIALIVYLKDRKVYGKENLAVSLQERLAFAASLDLFGILSAILN